MGRLKVITPLLGVSMPHDDSLGANADSSESTTLNLVSTLYYFMYDYVIVGSGLYGSVFAHQLKQVGLRILILERLSELGGNVHSSDRSGVMVHDYGPHIFHTKSKKVWDFVTSIAEFWPYRHRVKACFKDRLYTLPFNMSTYYEMWGCKTPSEAEEVLKAQRVDIERPKNLEEQALATIGPDLYHTLVYGYTKKQWQRDPKDLPASILRRIPLRMDFNNDYFNDWHQGIPVKGYTHFIEQLVDGVDVRLNSDFVLDGWRHYGRKLVYSGSLDELLGFVHGPLEYRGLRFVHEEHEGNFQGCSQMNYTDESVPYTRIVEHKHFHFQVPNRTVITYEFPIEWEPGLTRYYPIDDSKNRELHAKYRAMLDPDIIIGGRLGSYKYYDMDQVIGEALADSNRELT